MSTSVGVGRRTLGTAPAPSLCGPRPSLYCSVGADGHPDLRVCLPSGAHALLEAPIHPATANSSSSWEHLEAGMSHPRTSPSELVTTGWDCGVCAPAPTPVRSLALQETWVLPPDGGRCLTTWAACDLPWLVQLPACPYPLRCLPEAGWGAELQANRLGCPPQQDSWGALPWQPHPEAVRACVHVYIRICDSSDSCLFC